MSEILLDSDIRNDVNLFNFAIVKYRAYQAMNYIMKSRNNSLITNNAINFIMEKLESARSFILTDNHFIND